MTIRPTLSARIKLAVAETLPAAAAPTLPALLRGCGDIVYLSPHYDDICFSLGVLALTLGRGRIVNLFTRDAYAPRHGIIRATDEPAVARAMALRAAEDARFAGECGLERHDLGLDSAALRGRGSRDPQGVDDDRRLLREPLDALLAAATGGALLVPAGIGGHSNHVATMSHIAARHGALEDRWRLFFYEDLPYAISAKARRLGLLRLFDRMAGRRPRRHVLPLGDHARAKLHLVNLYASQFTEDVGDLARFTPAARRPGVPHEAVWTFR